MEKIKEVYGKYEHLGHLFSDKEWMGMGTDFRLAILHELWMAIKEEIEKFEQIKEVKTL